MNRYLKFRNKFGNGYVSVSGFDWGYWAFGMTARRGWQTTNIKPTFKGYKYVHLTFHIPVMAFSVKIPTGISENNK